MRFNTFVIALLAVIIFFSGFAQTAEQPPPKLTLISNVNIFDGKTEKLHKNMHILVKGNLIETVSNEPLAVVQTDNVTMIDGGYLYDHYEKSKEAEYQKGYKAGQESAQKSQ